jgi:hypothetical protein
VGRGEKLGKCQLYFWGKFCPSTYLLDKIEGGGGKTPFNKILKN